MADSPYRSASGADETHDEPVVTAQTVPVRVPGQGAVSNAGSRYLARQQELDPAEVARQQADGTPAVSLRAERTVNLLTRNRSPDIPFDRSINPYKGCEHGCIYCFARPTHAYLDLSPGADFERIIYYKTDVRAHLRTLFARPGYRCAPIALGTNTDPYQPAERRLRVTRQILETLLEHRHPLSIVTKGTALLDDLALLRELAELKLVKVMISVTTLSNELKARLEPRTAGPARRLAMIEALRGAGIPVGAMVAPVIPFLNDAELEDIVDACVARGASELNYILLRLPLEVGPLFEEWLAANYPLKAERVMAAVRQMRGGKRYDARWGTRMRGEGPYADLLAARFSAVLRRHHLGGTRLPALRTDLFAPHSDGAAPAVLARDSAQGDLFAD